MSDLRMEQIVTFSVNGKEEKYRLANFHDPEKIMDRFRNALSNLQGVSKIYQLWEIEWTEYELGWGCRPDGKTYYLTKDLADAAIKEYTKNLRDEVPDIYSQPSAPKLVDVSRDAYYSCKEKNGKMDTD